MRISIFSINYCSKSIPIKISKLECSMIQNYTNNILKEQNDKETVYYVPAYLRMKVKNFTAMDLGSLDAEVNSTVLFTVFYGDLEEDIVQFLSENIVFLFNRNDALQLKEGLETKFKRNKKEKTFSYTIRKLFSTRISTNVFWSPFEVANLILSITVQSVNIKTNRNKCIIKFNLMNHQSVDLKVSTSESRTFGSYDLAESLLDVEYTNKSVSSDIIAQQIKKEKQILNDQQKKQRKKVDQSKNHSKSNNFNENLHSPTNLIQPTKYSNQAQSDMPNLTLEDSIGQVNNANLIQVKKKQIIEEIDSISEMQKGKIPVKVIVKKSEQKIFTMGVKGPKQFQYAHFNIPLYKYPIVAVITIFLPLWLLSIINLGIFFQNSQLHDRIASIAGVMIAFVALVPTIRSQLPPSPKITIVEILVYLQTLTSLFCLIQSISVRNNKQFTIIWYEDGFFMASAVITLLQIIVVSILCLLHKLYWQPSYNQSQPKAGKFSIKQWKNQSCDLHFQMFQNLKIFSAVENAIAEKYDY